MLFPLGWIGVLIKILFALRMIAVFVHFRSGLINVKFSDRSSNFLSAQLFGSYDHNDATFKLFKKEYKHVVLQLLKDKQVISRVKDITEAIKTGDVIQY
jgi:hypothetical protein